jgi:hypothetical protein
MKLKSTQGIKIMFNSQNLMPTSSFNTVHNHEDFIAKLNRAMYEEQFNLKNKNTESDKLITIDIDDNNEVSFEMITIDINE